MKRFAAIRELAKRARRQSPRGNRPSGRRRSSSDATASGDAMKIALAAGERENTRAF